MEPPVVPTSVTDVPDFPYPSFDEFVTAVRRREAFLAVDQAFAVQWSRFASSRGGAGIMVLHSFLAASLVWVGLVAAGLAWTDLGPWGLGLILVSFLAGMQSRPWRGKTAVGLAVFAIMWGVILHIAWLQWIGVTWAATYLVHRLLYADATRRFTADLLHNEKHLAAALTPTPKQQAHIVTAEEIKAGGGDWRKSGA